jgi:hypothetical protein
MAAIGGQQWIGGEKDVESAVVKQGAGAVMEGGAEPEVGQSQYV